MNTPAKYLTILLASLLTACTTVRPTTNPQASTRVPCPDAPVLTGGSGKEVLLWGVDIASAYRLCAAQHKALIDSLPKP